MNISDKIFALANEAEREMADIFADIDRTALENTAHVLDVFRENRVSDSYFAPSTGYGHGDIGREAIDRICAGIFRCEAGFMRHNFISGTHALTVGLFGLLRPGDIMLSVTGIPYDTIHPVIGIDAEGCEKKDGTGSLADFGVEYRNVPLAADGHVDLGAVRAAMESCGGRLRVIYMQRSKGYLDRPTLSVSEIKSVAASARRMAAELSIPVPFVMLDNCYGEFTEEDEPCSVTGDGGEVDLMAGSLIKNPGGGMADCGGYIAGKSEAVELAGYRLSCPGIGLDGGASLGQNRNILRGLFFAPHVVASALKTAHLAAYVFEALGFKVSPSFRERRHDIIQTVECGTPEGLVSFCRGIQEASPVDSFAVPEPSDMPGYADKVVMAAGAFVGGASIELSCDGPMREPYTAFLQGGLTYEAGKLGILSAASAVDGARAAGRGGVK